MVHTQRCMGYVSILQGLHPSNMFACGVDFLLRLKPEALAPHAEQFQALLDPGTLKIGIHIRVGDQQLVCASICRARICCASY